MRPLIVSVERANMLAGRRASINAQKVPAAAGGEFLGDHGKATEAVWALLWCRSARQAVLTAPVDHARLAG